MPSVCCEPLPDAGAKGGKKDAGAGGQVCLVACDYNTQAQLCANDNDCQAGPPTCTNGICVN